MVLSPVVGYESLNTYNIIGNEEENGKVICWHMEL